MVSSKVRAAVVTGALLSCVGWNVASAQSTGQAPGDTAAYVGRVYALHSKSIGGCPALDWHIVVGENQTLSGMVSLNDMKTIFRINGTYNSEGTFKLVGKQVGGSLTGAVNGQIRRADGVLVATLGGLPVGSACQGKSVYMKWSDNTGLGAGG